MSSARAQTQTARSEDKRANHEATAPPTIYILSFLCVCVCVCVCRNYNFIQLQGYKLYLTCELEFYWLISDTLQDLIKNVDIIAAIKTDHSDIVLHLQGVEETKKGPGFWKMNTSVLSDEKFIQLMKMNLEVWKEEGKELSDIRVAWDWIKYNVHLFSMQYSKELARIKREKEESLQKKLQAAQIQFQQNQCEEFEKI